MKRTSVVTLYPTANFFYAYSVSGGLTEEQQETIESAMECPTWDTNTQFRIDFSNGLIAGNASFGDNPPTQYAIYRQEMGGSTLKLVATIPGDRRSFTDYSVKNKNTYRYYVYPASTTMIGDPFVTGYASYETYYWELLLANSTDESNVYTLDSIYKFEFNPGDISIQNNTEANKIRTFSRYLRVQKDSVNCWSGTLSALVGVYDCDTSEYVESIEMLDAIQELSTDPRRKFLRDYVGHLYEIDVSSPIEFSQKVASVGSVTTKKLEWTEVGNGELAQIVAVGDIDE